MIRSLPAAAELLPRLAFDARGLAAVVAQDAFTGAVLMLAWADREAVERTLATGEAWFWSRSRRALWRKGETSGNTLAVVGVAIDCDGDALLYRVHPSGPACHTGATSCFDGEGDGLELEFPAGYFEAHPLTVAELEAEREQLERWGTTLRVRERGESGTDADDE